MKVTGSLRWIKASSHRAGHDVDHLLSSTLWSCEYFNTKWDYCFSLWVDLLLLLMTDTSWKMPTIVQHPKYVCSKFWKIWPHPSFEKVVLNTQDHSTHSTFVAVDKLSQFSGRFKPCPSAMWNERNVLIKSQNLKSKIWSVKWSSMLKLKTIAAKTLRSFF